MSGNWVALQSGRRHDPSAASAHSIIALPMRFRAASLPCPRATGSTPIGSHTPTSGTGKPVYARFLDCLLASSSRPLGSVVGRRLASSRAGCTVHPRARRATLSHHSVAAFCIFQSRHCDTHPGARSTLSWTLRNRRRRRLTISGNRHSDLRLRFRHRSDEQARTLLLGPFFARLAVPSVGVLSSNGVSCTAVSIRNVHHYVYTRAALRRRHVEHFPAMHFIFARHCLLRDELDTDAPKSGEDGFRRPTLRLPVLPTRSPATTRHRPLPSPSAPVFTTQSSETSTNYTRSVRRLTSLWPTSHQDNMITKRQ